MRWRRGPLCVRLRALLADDRGGWYDHPTIHAAVETYLAELDGFDYDRLILGCTHYPLIHDLLQRRVGQAVTVIDSSDAVAAMIPPETVPERAGRCRLAFSDSPELSMPIVERIFTQPIHAVERMSWGTASG